MKKITQEKASVIFFYANKKGKNAHNIISMEKIKKISIGLMAGIICGLFASGGGLVLIPALVYWLHLEEKQARATALWCIAPMVLTAFFLYSREDLIEWKTRDFMCNRWNCRRNNRSEVNEENSRHRLKSIVYWFAFLFCFSNACPIERREKMPVIYGIVSGILSGFGMGGGTILILCLTTWEKMEQHVAQATSLVFFLAASISAILTNRKKIPVDKKLVTTIVTWGGIGAIIGAVISLNMGVQALRKAFGIFLMAIVANEWYSIYKMYKKRKKGT